MTEQSNQNELVSLIKRVHLATRRAYDEAFAAYGVTGPQANVLQHVWQQDGIELRTVQERVGVTGATLTGIIDGLVERELVERRLSPQDARVKHLFLTERGRLVSNELSTIIFALQNQLAHGFSPSEKALLRDWLHRMAENMGAPNSDTCD